MKKITSFLENLSNFDIIISLFVVGFLVYLNSLFNGFVGDDASQIVNNPLVRSLKNTPSFFSGGTFYLGDPAKLYGTYYKPILSSYHSFVYSIFGLNSIAFHFSQILFHIVNTSLLFLLFSRFFSRLTAFALSLVFLVHPINSEVVFYISDTQDALFFFFGVSALLLTTKKTIKVHTAALAGTLLLLSLLSKETGLLFVIVVMFYSFIFNRRYFYHLLIPSFLAFSTYLLLRINAIKVFTLPGNSPIAKLNIWERLINMPEILLFYFKTFFFPLNLSISYYWIYKELSFSYFFLPLIINLLFIGVLFYFAFKLYKDHENRQLFKIYVFFFIWFLLGLFMHLQIIPLDATVAERWFYFPIVGLLGMIGTILSAFRIKFSRTWSFLIIFVLLLILSARTIARSFDWKDVWTLYTHDTKVSKDNFALENGLADYLLNQRKYQEAMIHAQKSVKAYPYFTNYNTLGAIYSRLGNHKKAKESFLSALEYGDFHITYENLAVIALSYGNPEHDIPFIKNALKKYPTSSKLWLSLAILEYKNNQVEDAKLSIMKLYEFDKSAITTYFYKKIMNEEQLDESFK